MTRIPMWGRSGIVAYALVDEADASRVSSFRWWLAPNGYARRHGRIDGRRVTVYMHREVLGLKYGDRASVDHINRDGLDNRRANLRIASHAENMQNRPAHRGGGSSPFRGVHWDTACAKWVAVVRYDGRNRRIGCFTDEIDAARAAEAFRAEHMPFAQPDPALAQITVVLFPAHGGEVSTTPTSSDEDERTAA